MMRCCIFCFVLEEFHLVRRVTFNSASLHKEILHLWHCISCPPSGQVSGGFVLFFIEQDVAQSEQLELRKLEDLSRLSRALRLIYTTCGFLMYT